MSLVLDLFAGIGGWDIALKERGQQAFGVDNNKHVVTTRRAAGLYGSGGYGVRDLIVNVFDGVFSGLVASPPCQAFSQAANHVKGTADPRGQLVWEPLRWKDVRGIDFICLEQVKGAKPQFEQIALVLREDGWSADLRVVNAADYGLPQARKRLLFAARRDGEPIEWPEPTHAWQGAGGLPDWVTLAEGLRAGDTYTHNLPDWCYRRPATTIVGSFRPEVVAAPGWRKSGDPPRQDTPNSARLSLPQRLVLQGFPHDWPVQGPKTARDLQVGNAIPPVLAGVALDAAGVR